MPDEDPRYERLPKWAKAALTARGERILALERDLAAVRALLNDEVPEDAPVVVDPHSVNRRRLMVDRWTPIEFRYKPDDDREWWSYFHVTLHADNRLSVHGSTGILVKPQSGNSVEIFLEKR